MSTFPLEIPSKEDALKELSERIWYEDEQWDFLRNSLDNTDKLWKIDETASPLFLASIGQDLLQQYLERFWYMAEDALLVRTKFVCKDCYDVLTSEGDPATEDVFIHYYGPEEGPHRYMVVYDAISSLEKDGNFWKEIPELVNPFSKNQCQCCLSRLHGERFFMVFENKIEMISLEEANHGNVKL